MTEEAGKVSSGPFLFCDWYFPLGLGLYKPASSSYFRHEKNWRRVLGEEGREEGDCGLSVTPSSYGDLIGLCFISFRLFFIILILWSFRLCFSQFYWCYNVIILSDLAFISILFVLVCDHLLQWLLHMISNLFFEFYDCLLQWLLRMISILLKIFEFSDHLLQWLLHTISILFMIFWVLWSSTPMTSPYDFDFVYGL